MFESGCAMGSIGVLNGRVLGLKFSLSLLAAQIPVPGFQVPFRLLGEVAEERQPIHEDG
jgi:hypothetical protein